MSGRETLESASGLLDDYQLTVAEAWFGTDDESEYNQDRIYLFLRGEATVDGEVVEEEYRERYSVGNGWEVVDEGRAIEHGSGKNKTRRGSGHFWLVAGVVSAFEAAGEKDALYDRVDEHGTNEADFWEGLVIDFERKVVSTFKDNDGNDRDFEVPMAVGISIGGGKKKAKGKSKAKSGKAKGDDPELKLRKKLVKLAGTFDEDDHDDFVEAALEKHGDALSDFDELHAEMLDEDEELWAEAHAS